MSQAYGDLDVTLDENGKRLLTEVQEVAIKEGFYELACIMARLRKDCPWDRKQTAQSLKRYVLEEAYEVVESIDDQDWNGLCDELGDFLFQVIFQAKVQEESGHFDLADVLRGINEKMVRRHPHVFQSQDLTAEEVSANWEAIKKAEKSEAGEAHRSLFDGHTRGLPALLDSYKIARRAARVGFDWPDPMPVLDKIEEEIAEVREALSKGDREAVQEEMGDLLFAMSNLVRKLHMEPEETLRKANAKFVRRFRKMEELAEADAVEFAALDLDEQEAYWQRAKGKK